MGAVAAKDLSYSKSPCCPNAFHHVWAQSHLGSMSRCGLKIIKMAAVGAILRYRDYQDGHCGSHTGYQNITILAILNFYVALMPPIKFQLNLTYYLGDVA